MDYSKKEIGLVIKEYRERAGLTQDGLAKLVGKKQQTVASWECGQGQPDANMLFTLFDIFGTSIDCAFGFKKTAPAKKQGLRDDEDELLRNYQRSSEDDKRALRRFAAYAAQEARARYLATDEAIAAAAGASLDRQFGSPEDIREAAEK